ncbi:hypothetical protein ACFPRL_33205 [Pseudoclavibacter helvolus]
MQPSARYCCSRRFASRVVWPHWWPRETSSGQAGATRHRGRRRRCGRPSRAHRRDPRQR